MSGCGSIRAQAMNCVPASRKLDAVPPTQGACGEKDDGPQKLQHSTHCDADNPKGKQQQPDQRIQNKRHQGQRPAQYKQNAPQDESHRDPLFAITLRETERFLFPTGNAEFCVVQAQRKTRSFLRLEGASLCGNDFKRLGGESQINGITAVSEPERCAELACPAYCGGAVLQTQGRSRLQQQCAIDRAGGGIERDVPSRRLNDNNSIPVQRSIGDFQGIGNYQHAIAA